ncbi:Os11g0476333 [Oryza sativa Japonica Group]|uniref:Os11g0476333 protein n=1 Tax=Oryza sativa subsp. japonica TaxID=39947 RepID=A0A0P0Y2J5_ORYSJ|nr:Os11g0476333 [Oryza sativa Japonica Group]
MYGIVNINVPYVSKTIMLLSRYCASCRNMNSAIIKGGSARDLKVDGCGDKGFRQVQALSMRGNTLLLFGDLNPPDVF